MYCANEKCYATICLDSTEISRLRQTHETFYCPAGHENYFPGETRAEKKLRIERQRGNDWRDRWSELRTTWGTCPFGCGWVTQAGPDRVWLQMFKHFSKKHGNMLPSRMVWASRPEQRRKVENARRG
jgi:hypothetical protein